jgi:hypothetical protein
MAARFDGTGLHLGGTPLACRRPSEFAYASLRVDKLPVHLLNHKSLHEQALDRLVCQITGQYLSGAGAATATAWSCGACST